MVAESTLLRHTELPAQSTWNAPSVFPSDEAWENEWNAINAGLSEQTQKYQGHLADSADPVFECLPIRDEILRRAKVLMVYANMASSVGSNDQKEVAMSGRARSLYGQVLATFAFVEPERLVRGA